MVAAAASIAAWLLSDARRVQKLERAWDEAFRASTRRLEALERGFPEWQTAMASLADEASDVLKRAEAKRRRVEGAAAPQGNGPQPVTRDDYLRAVAEQFRGR